jgi:hypothetical protein
MPVSDGTRDSPLETSAIGPVLHAKHLAPHGEQCGNRLNSGAFLSLLGLLAVLTLGRVIYLSERGSSRISRQFGSVVLANSASDIGGR